MPDASAPEDPGRAPTNEDARYHLLFQQNPQVMWVYESRTGRFLDVNAAAVEKYGYTRDEFLGMTIYDIRPQADVAEVREAVARAAASPDQLGPARDWRHRRKDGTVMHVRVQAHGTMHGGLPAQLVLVTDVTAERQLEERLRQSQKMEALGTLAAGVAHDFNNLLTVINGYADVIAARLPDDNPNRADLEQVRLAGGRAVTLTQQLLAFSRRQVLRPRQLAPAAVLAEMEPRLAHMLPEHVSMRMDLPRDLPPILIDPTQLELVLLNLVVNAVDAMPDGGAITIEAAAHEAAPPLPDADLPPGPCLVISVADQGGSMDDAALARAFEPFFTPRARGRSHGLALSTAFGIVKQSGGHLAAFSEPGVGCTFRVYLPAAQSSGEQAPVSRPADTAQLRGSGTVLLVEDDEGVRRLVEAVLTEAGYDVLVASDGTTAIDLAARHAGRIDLLLTDVVMPGMGGRAVADGLRQQLGPMRVLYMSGHAENAVLMRGVLEPGIQFLPKPFTPATLLQEVRDALARPVLQPCIVVADDEAPLRHLLSRTLTRAGYEVLEAGNGRQALELCGRHRVDLLLTDLVMPEQEGLETIRELRRFRPHVRIVAMSGAFDGKFLQVARAFGADAVLQKPFDGQSLLAVVAGLIGRPEPHAD